MTLLTDLEKIKSRTAVLVFLTLILLITPGIAILFIYNKSLFLQLDTLKLILLSIAIISPLVILNYLFSGNNAEDKKQQDLSFLTLVLSVFLSGLIIFSALIFGYSLKKDIYTVIKIIFFLQILFVVNGIYESFKNKK